MIIEEPEMCLVDNCTTNTIFRDTNRTGNITSIARSNANIIRIEKIIVVLPLSTKSIIEYVLLYLESNHTLLIFKDIHTNHYQTKMRML